MRYTKDAVLSVNVVLIIVTFAAALRAEKVLYRSASVCMCLCVRSAANARHISLGGEGNALYPLLSS